MTTARIIMPGQYLTIEIPQTTFDKLLTTNFNILPIEYQEKILKELGQLVLSEIQDMDY